MLCEMAASVKSEKILNRDQFDQAHTKNQWWLSIPKKALLTKLRSPTDMLNKKTTFNGAGLGISTQLNVHLRDFFLAF